jgi:cytochrome c-type biogenesis protein CcmH
VSARDAILAAVVVLFMAVLLPAAHAQGAMPASPLADRPLADPAREAAAQSLMAELRCLVCQNQSIADSNAEMAGDMRALVRERISAGDTPADVRAYLVSRYGDWVTFRPPFSARTALLWATPIVLLLVGALLAARQFRRPAR